MSKLLAPERAARVRALRKQLLVRVQSRLEALAWEQAQRLVGQPRQAEGRIVRVTEVGGRLLAGFGLFEVPAAANEPAFHPSPRPTRPKHPPRFRGFVWLDAGPALRLADNDPDVETLRRLR